MPAQAPRRAAGHSPRLTFPRERMRRPRGPRQVACCRLGYVFNKETVIEQLLERRLHPKFKHIKGLKVRRGARPCGARIADAAPPPRCPPSVASRTCWTCA